MLNFNFFDGRQWKIEEVSTILTYIGTAPRGDATSDATWTMYEVSEAGTPTVTSIKTAGAVDAWDDRATQTYK